MDASRVSSGQGLLAGGVATVIDLERRLCCLSLNLALRFIAISFSSFGSLMMRGTIGSTSKSEVVLAMKANAKKVEANGDTGAGVGAFLAALVASFFLVGE